MKGITTSILLSRYNRGEVLSNFELTVLRDSLVELVEFFKLEKLRPLAYWYEHTLESIERILEARKK